MKNLQIIYMSFDYKKVIEIIVDTIHKSGVKRNIQIGVLNSYGDAADPFPTWNSLLIIESVTYNGA